MARERVDIVEIGKRGVAKTPRLLGIVVGMDRHRLLPGYF
jgi:hypothetical protein